MRILVALLVGCAAPAWSAELTGTVRIQGRPPATHPHAVDRDAAACGASVPDDSLELSRSGGIGDAVVYIENPPPAPRHAPAKHRLDQVHCRYVPHVVAAQVGDTLVVTSSDDALHNVNAQALSGQTAFNFAFPLPGLERSVPLPRPGPLHLRCNVHPWMEAWVQVFAHPYFAVTDPEGRFHIFGLPEGEYTVVAWQERLGTVKLRTHVGGKARPMLITFAADRARPGR